MNNLLDAIEDKIFDDPTADSLSEILFVSSVHLQRLFKAAFGVSIANYIRSRKLAKSLDHLVAKEWHIADIAVEFGFDHAQSYIRAFKKEFDTTPGELRKTGKVVEVKPPIRLFPQNEYEEGLMFGPEFVFVPGLFCIGKSINIPAGADAAIPANAAIDFWFENKGKIVNVKKPDTYIGLTKFPDDSYSYSEYIPSVRVSNLSHIPEGFIGNSIPSCMCARFHYVGEHSCFQINANVAQGMYNEIFRHRDSEESRLWVFDRSMYFEKIIPSECDDSYCKMEWFSPVREKQND